MKTLNICARGILGLLLLVAAAAEGATIPVDDGFVAVAADAKCSLREAIANANAGSDTTGGECVAGTGGPDTVELATDGTYTITDVDNTDPKFGANGLPIIATDITVDGNGATVQRDAALSGGTPCNTVNFRLFHVDPTGALVLDGLTVTNGCASGYTEDGGGGALLVEIGGSAVVRDSSVVANQARVGGGIINCGDLVVEDSEVSNNLAESSAGGIQNDGSLVLTDSAVANNRVTVGAGAGIVNNDALNVDGSTLNNNVANAASGGALYNSDMAQAPPSLATTASLSMATGTTFNNSTVTSNSVPGCGGGMQLNGKVRLTNVTMTGNSAGAGGAIQSKSSSLAEISNSIIAAQLLGGNCSGGAVVSLGYNLDSDSSCVTDGLNNDKVAGSPVLMALADNNGPTLTHALGTGSPALDSGACVNSVDQRGFGRPEPSGTLCDIGSYEVQCGDGASDVAEECDDGNASDNDVCPNTCTDAECGDGAACTDGACTSGAGGGPEECDDGNADQTDACLNDCSVATCGDGFACTDGGCTSGPLGGPEECDDGNAVDLDGCSNVCQSGVSDSDADGVSSGTESMAPNSGDGNDDGTADSLQSGVASIALPGGSYITLEIGGGCAAATGVALFTPGSGHPNDPLFTFVADLVGFKLNCEEADITVYYHDLSSFPSGTVYRKFGPIAPDFGGPAEFYTLPGVSFGSTVIDGATVATASFTLRDGELGDDTGDDGMIVDQGGPATPIVSPAPALSPAMLAVALAILLVIAMPRLARVRRRD